MKPGLGWVHIKDYRKVSGKARGKHVEEDALANFVPADIGAGGHDKILADLHDACCRRLSKKLEQRGIPGVFLDLEPHVRGGGQFGGTSGPDGMGIALRGLCRVLDRRRSPTISATSTTCSPPAACTAAASRACSVRSPNERARPSRAATSSPTIRRSHGGRRGAVPDVLAAFAAPPTPASRSGLYLHVPFCRKRCKFCYFRVYTDVAAADVERYSQALGPRGGARRGRSRRSRAGTLRYVYFGGGTPSFLSVKQLERLVARAARELRLATTPRR